MSFGAGHVQDMNNRIKQNRENRPSNKAKFKENNRDVIYGKNNTQKTLLKNKHCKTTEAKAITEIQNRLQRDNQRQRIINTFIFIVVFGSILYFFVIK